MIANYHTHTWRCNHAQDTEREYASVAFERGIRTLGFADHAPYFFDGDYYSGFRMKREEYPDYVRTLRAIGEEYKGKMDVLVGLEMEYYPKHFAKTLDFLNEVGLDYLILGQHCMDHTETWQVHAPTEDEKGLATYADIVLEGAATGVFSCVAHPDHFKYLGDSKIWYKHMKRMCQGLKDMHVPVEMNLLGFAEGRHYPRSDFFDIVREVGNDVIIGCDAHSKAQMGDTAVYERAVKWLEDKGITPISTLPVLKPCLCR